MAQGKSPSRPAARPQKPQTAHATISARWLLAALALTVPAAALCTWAVFCLLFWQGSWQLLYHPTSTVTRNPSNIGLAYDPVSFSTANSYATTNSGVPQIQGWWIPATSARYTAIYLHDQTGNLGDTLDALAELHATGMNVFAFDYRGFGQSQFVHPSESSWNEDAASALEYLTGTRHIDTHSIVIVGSGLGADIALELAAAHSDSAGVVLESPIDSPVNIVFNDARAKLLPAHLLVRDRYDLSTPAGALHIPSLWLEREHETVETAVNSIFEKANAPKARVVLRADETLTQPIQSWLTNLGNK